MPAPEALTVAQARAWIEARTGHRVGSTLYRWLGSGVKVNGQTVRLAGTRVGHQWVTTAEAIETFLAACGTPVEAESATPADRTPGQRRRGADAALESLRAMGVKV